MSRMYVNRMEKSYIQAEKNNEVIEDRASLSDLFTHEIFGRVGIVHFVSKHPLLYILESMFFVKKPM